MAVGTFIAGPSTATYNAQALGLTEQGWQLSISYAKELINATDRFGDTVVDGVFRGVSSVMLTALGLEYTNNLLAALMPYQATPLTASGATFFDIGVPGVLDSSKGAALVLTAIAGTTAVATPATLTAHKAIIRENEQLQWAFDCRLRKVPLPFRLLPVLTSSTYRFFTNT